MDRLFLIIRLAKNDFKSRYAASLFGIMWAFIQPIVTILVFWFVFQAGFKSNPVDDAPYILWFVVAYVPWIYFSDMMNFGVNSLADYSYLVKKVKFNVEYLPFIRILSSLFVHLFFILFIFFMFFYYKNPVSIYCIQCLYYSFALTVFTGGAVLLLSALSVFFRDVSQIVLLVLQIGFWATPIFWNINDIDNKEILKVLKLNPLQYIVTGYRESFIYEVAFWDKPLDTLYFWVSTLIICILGYWIFKRLRPHFADEL